MRFFSRFFLPRPKEILSPLRKRYLLLPHMMMGLVVGVTSIFDEETRESSIVFNLIFSWVNPTIWAVAFLITAVFAAYGILSGSWRAYAATNLLTIGLSSAFLLSLTVAKLLEGVYVSPIILALWVFVLTNSIVLSTISNKVIRTRG